MPVESSTLALGPSALGRRLAPGEGKMRWSFQLSAFRVVCSWTLFMFTHIKFNSMEVSPLSKHPDACLTTIILAVVILSFDSITLSNSPRIGKGVELVMAKRRFFDSSIWIFGVFFAICRYVVSSMMFSADPLLMWNRTVAFPIVMLVWKLFFVFFFFFRGMAVWTV